MSFIEPTENLAVTRIRSKLKASLLGSEAGTGIKATLVTDTGLLSARSPGRWNRCTFGKKRFRCVGVHFLKTPMRTLSGA